jgi:hypothetical protein
MSELEHPTFPHLTKRIIRTVHLQPNFHFGIPCADWLRFVMNRIDPAAPHKNPRLIGTRLRPIPPRADAGPTALGRPSTAVRVVRVVWGAPWGFPDAPTGCLQAGYATGKMARRECRSPFAVIAAGLLHERIEPGGSPQ